MDSGNCESSSDDGFFHKSGKVKRKKWRERRAKGILVYDLHKWISFMTEITILWLNFIAVLPFIRSTSAGLKIPGKLAVKLKKSACPCTDEWLKNLKNRKRA